MSFQAWGGEGTRHEVKRKILQAGGRSVEQRRCSSLVITLDATFCTHLSVNSHRVIRVFGVLGRFVNGVFNRMPTCAAVNC